MWGELKKPVTMTLTPTSISGLDVIAHGLGLSRFELVERIGRGVIPIQPNINEHTATRKSNRTLEVGGTL